MLLKCVSNDPRSWDKIIELLMLAYSEVPFLTTGFYSFELMYGRTARDSLQLFKEELTQPSISEKRQSAFKYILDLREGEIECSELVRAHAGDL